MGIVPINGGSRREDGELLICVREDLYPATG